MAEAPASPLVRVLTTEGELLIRLDADRAPASSAGFLRFIDEGRYVGGAFGRTVSPANDQGSPPISVIQAMAADAAAYMADPPQVAHEPTGRTGLKHLDGAVSLPRTTGQGGSPVGFVICIGDQPGLDQGTRRAEDGEGFAVFGRLIEGGDVARRIHQAPTLPDAPIPYLKGQVMSDPVTILAARREPEDAAGRLKALAEDYWAFRNAEFPMEASQAGEPGHGDRLDRVSVEDFARRAEVAAGLSRRLDGIGAEGLSEADVATRGLLANQLELMVEAFRRGVHMVPQLYIYGFHSTPLGLIQTTPLNRRKDVEDLLTRLEAMPAFFAANTDLIRAAMAEGYRVPRVLLARVRGMISAAMADGGVPAFLRLRLAQPVPGLDETAMGALRARAESAVTEAVLPALKALDDFLQAEAEALLMDSTSVCDQPGGEDIYRFKVAQQTTTALSPEEIHRIGEEELARIHAEVQAVLDKAGFKGTARAYADLLDQRFEPSGEALLQKTRALAKKIDGRLPRFVGRLPRLTYGVEPFTPEQSLQMPPGMAEPGPPDCSMAGVYWITALPERCPNHLLVPLGLHEAWPGHVMQFAIANELELPAFRKACWTDYNGYVEGWALYCEAMGHDLGLYDDPADHFGRLTFDLWRACRLVVDTGLHWYRWDRQRAVEYMAANTFMPRETIETEIDRYIGMPAQALSYKIGERCIRGLRAEAEAALGERFSLRGFHDAILATGPVTLQVLEAAVRRWIESERGAMTEAAIASAPPAATGPASVGEDHVLPGGWYTLWAVLGVTMFAFVDRQLLTLAAAPLQAALRLSDSQLGLVQGLAFAVFTVAAVYPIAWAADRMDRRWVLGTCIVLWSLGTAACGLAQNFIELFLAAVAIAAGEAGLVPLTMAIVPDLFKGRKRALANGIQYFAAYVGVSLALMLGGAALSGLDAAHAHLPPVLRQVESWRIAFFLLAVPAPVFLVAIAFARLGHPRAEATGQRPADVPLLPFLRAHAKAMMTVLGALGFYLLAFGGFFVWLPVVSSRLFATTPAQNGMGMGIGTAAGMVAGVAASTALLRRLMPRIGRRASVRIVWWTALLTTPVLVLFPFITAAWQGYALMGLLMLAGTGIGVLVATILQDMAPAAMRARFLAIYSICAALLQGCAPTLVGLASDRIGGPRSLLWALSLVALPAWIGSTVLMRFGEPHFARLAEAVAEADRG